MYRPAIVLLGPPAPDVRDGPGFATHACSHTGAEVIASTARAGASAAFTPIPAPSAWLALAGVALAPRRRRRRAHHSRTCQRERFQTRAHPVFHLAQLATKPAAFRANVSRAR